MNYQMLVLDLDGTLTNSKKEVSQATLKALIDIQNRGKKVVLASGRPTRGVAPLAGLLRLHEFGSYILSFNGGRITDCRSNQIIYEKTLPDDVAEERYTQKKCYPAGEWCRQCLLNQGAGYGRRKTGSLHPIRRI